MTILRAIADLLAALADRVASPPPAALPAPRATVLVITSAMVARGDVAPGNANGVAVPPALRINAESRAEHHARMLRDRWTPLTDAENRRLFPEEA